MNRRKSNVYDDNQERIVNEIKYFYERDEIKSHVQRVISEERKRYEIDDTVKSVIEEKSFRDWASEERAKHKRNMIEKEKGGSQDWMNRQKILDNEEKIDRDLLDDGDDGMTRGDMGEDGVEGCYGKIKHIKGYMYGPFTSMTSKTDKLTETETKFAIPLTMIKRYEKANAKEKLRQTILRNARFTHMGIPLPPENDDSSDGSVEEIKTLALIRTPYFRLPLMKTQQKKKKDRFKNQYLNKERLRRITMLMYDRSLSKSAKMKSDRSDKNPNQTETSLIQNVGLNLLKISTAKPKKSFAAIVRKRFGLKLTPMKEKYFKLIREKYLKHRKLYDDNVEVSHSQLYYYQNSSY